MNQKLHIVSLGCPKNLIDSEMMASILEKDGLVITAQAEEADIILINTCTFILPAREESIDEILRLAELKKTGSLKNLVVAGCLPQRYGHILEEELPEVDLFVGTGEIYRIAKLIHSLKDGFPHKRTYVGAPKFLMTAKQDRILSSPRHSTYIRIAEGCSNHCSYCVIPTVRGAYRSRKIDDIVAETERLAERGVKEIILTAQETSAYGKDIYGEPVLDVLLKELVKVDKISWVRILYTYPESITRKILETMAAEEKILKYIDIPVQHIDDEILRGMRRRGGSSEIRRILALARAIMPDIAIRTSLIVGFPGEKRRHFNNLLRFIQETRFDHLGVFSYSREEGTPAFDLPLQVTKRTKERRKGQIMEEQALISFEINQSLIGRQISVMIDGKSDVRGYDYAGRAERQAPDIDGITYLRSERRNLKVGEIIQCSIISADDYDLYALDRAMDKL